MKTFLNTFQQKLMEPTDNAPLVLFRALFGFLLSCEVLGKMFSGWVYRLYIYPQHNFSFMGFEWTQNLQGHGMYIYFGTMAILAWMIMLGWKHRFAAFGFFIMWGAVYFMQKSYYNNHDYLYWLMSGLMVFLPASNNFSIDAKRNPALRSLDCPKWCLWFFIAQIWIVYTFAAIAKMHPDWLATRPLGLWFDNKTDVFLFGDLLTKQSVQYLIAYGGLLFDLTIVPLLLWKRTRPYFFVLSLCFHLTNSCLFSIGTFPYMMIALSVFFFPPEKIKAIFFKKRPAFIPSPGYSKKLVMPTVLAYSLSIYFLVQIALPLRHFVYPGDVTWTEEGHRLSWRMMVRSKKGDIAFRVFDKKTGQMDTVDPATILTNGQTNLMAHKPDMIWQFAQLLKERYKEKGQEVSIYAWTSVSLNGHPARPIVDESVDLAATKWNYFTPNKWILPFEQETTPSSELTLNK